MSPDQIGAWAGFVLTLMVFSYLLGDNFLYRIAVYAFVGLAAGFLTIVTFETVLLPWFAATVLAPNAGIGERAFGMLPVLLATLLLLKASPRFGRLGNLGIAVVVGVGAAVALTGAVAGTLLPLSTSTANSPRADVVNGFVLVIGVIATLVSFQYLARRTPMQTGINDGRRGVFVRALGAIGQGFIAVTLGALYGGAILTGLTLFSERVAYLVARIGGG